jgi:hypothetical protein
MVELGKINGRFARGMKCFVPRLSQPCKSPKYHDAKDAGGAAEKPVPD